MLTGKQLFLDDPETWAQNDDENAMNKKEMKKQDSDDDEPVKIEEVNDKK